MSDTLRVPRVLKRPFEAYPGFRERSNRARPCRSILAVCAPGCQFACGMS
jgi:hypothetical protein